MTMNRKYQTLDSPPYCCPLHTLLYIYNENTETFDRSLTLTLPLLYKQHILRLDAYSTFIYDYLITSYNTRFTESITTYLHKYNVGIYSTICPPGSRSGSSRIRWTRPQKEGLCSTFCLSLRRCIRIDQRVR